MPDAEALMRTLHEDLTRVAADLADDESAAELYRALAAHAWRKRDTRGELRLGPGEAEQVVNRLREQTGEPPLPLSGTGREGEVSDRVEYALSSLGWRADLPAEQAGPGTPGSAAPADPR